MDNKKKNENLFKKFKLFKTHIQVIDFIIKMMCDLEIIAIEITYDLNKNKITGEIALKRCQEEIIQPLAHLVKNLSFKTNVLKLEEHFTSEINFFDKKKHRNLVEICYLVGGVVVAFDPFAQNIDSYVNDITLHNMILNKITLNDFILNYLHYNLRLNFKAIYVKLEEAQIQIQYDYLIGEIFLNNSENYIQDENKDEFF